MRPSKTLKPITRLTLARPLVDVVVVLMATRDLSSALALPSGTRN